MEKVQYIMIDRQYKKPGRSGERGAALIVAIAIMTILLAVALTFYAVSRAEVDRAINVKNQVQVDLLLDAAHAMAQAELNRDFLKHPNATSLDAAPFSLFNGSWAVGKQWALRFDPTQGINVPLQQGGVPLVNLSAMPYLDFGGGNVEQMFNGARSKDWLTIPRFDGATPIAYADVIDTSTGLPYTNIFDLSSRNRAPFVTPAFYGPSLTSGGTDEKYPLEWIHTWTDVDNDGDGLNDAIWIPLPQDKFFSGGEVVDDVTGRRMYDDGLDNDLDGIVDENQENRVNEDAADEVVAVLDDADEAIELASFVYHGLGPDRVSGDGFDNDGNGQIDEAGEDKLFLTTPLTDLIIPIDLNADGKVPDYVPNAATGEMEILRVVLPGQININGNPYDNSDVDVLDNDLDMLINDYNVYAYVGPNTLNGPPFRLRGFEDTGVIDPATGRSIIQARESVNDENSSAVSAGVPTFYDIWRQIGNWYPGDLDRFSTVRLKAYEEIDVESVFGVSNLTVLPAIVEYWSEYAGSVDTYDFGANLPITLRITHSGEPVCDLAGRAAITIRDESSAVNVNVAGAHTQNLTGTGLIRSLGSGRSATEYDTRVLPDIGVGLALGIFNQRTGTPTDASALSTAGANFFNSFSEDVVAPGYGRVDDNSNILIAALNGVDDDGDGLVDEGLYLPPPGDPSFALYYEQLGLFEGTDDPSELQRYRPLNNLLAEGRERYTLSGFSDGDDNDLDGALNEAGELGDLQLQDTLQIQDVPSLGTGRYGRLKQSLTTFSTDRNVNFVSGANGFRAINKLDYNLANPQQIAANLILSNSAEAITARQAYFANDPTLPAEPIDVTRSFADGLRQSMVHVRSTASGLLWETDPLSGLVTTPTVGIFPADPVLEILQAAVDIVDNRDSDHSRSVLITERRNRVPQTAATGLADYDTWPDRFSTRENTSEGELMPLGEIGAYALNSLGLNRKLEIKDEWWTFFAVDPLPVSVDGDVTAGVLGETNQPEERLISYTATGTEAIKINELMVRPVRRIEAEALFGLPGGTDPMAVIELPADTRNPVNYDPTGGYSELPDFFVGRASTGTSWTLTGNYIGEGTVLQTATAGDVLQFRIRATDGGLPAGRYYLTVNTNGSVIPQDPAGLGPMLEYSVKYENGTDIIGDGGTALFVPVPNAHISNTIPGVPAGSAFLNGVVEPAPAAYFTEGAGLIAFARTSANPTFTVLVPPAGSPDLLIAFRLAAAHNGTTIQIDSLDFSQEPDHEWVELVNSSDRQIDLSEWELEVGIPNTGDDVPPDPFKSQWRIPRDTFIAPNGTLLLAFSKYDHYQRDGSLDQASLIPYPGHRIADNGMGLAVSTGSPAAPFDGGFISSTNSLTNRTVTVPQIADVSSLLVVGSTYRDPTGSVFDRPAGVFADYIDRDGDGLSSIFNLAAGLDTDSAALENSLRSSTDGGAGDVNNDGLDDFSGVAMAARPWDRIVQMECLQWTTTGPLGAAPVGVKLDAIQSVDDVAVMVLRGGILPNYPEHDNIDNDGDGGYIDNGGIYIPGTLERDMVDNNLDGIIDERGVRFTALSIDGIDNDVDGSVDEPGELSIDGLDNDGDTLIDEYDELYLLSAGEGVDEGRIIGSEGVVNWRIYGPGSFEGSTLPNVFFNNRAAYGAQGTIPVTDAGSMIASVDSGGGYGFNSLTTGLASTNFFVTRVGDADVPLLPVTIPPGFITALGSYVGSEADPADWKAFTERRWNPGDNVIVTLYQGEAGLKKVADRVTYREYDVTNRTIDDIRAYGLDIDDDGLRDVPLTLNGDYPTFWLANSMCLDFYRSLERKSPLYNGDRFGTENRWQATDGNYDDWSDSLSYFEAEIESTLTTIPPVLASNTLVDPRVRFNSPRQERLFRHAMSGSPLRMNAAARKSLNPPDLERVVANQIDPTQFFNPLDVYRTHEDGVYNSLTNATPSLVDQTWNHSRAQVANRFYDSPGDLMRVPHQTYLHDAVNTTGGSDFLRDMTMLNIGVQGDGPINNGASYIQDIALRGATLGQDDYGNSVTGNILTAAVNSMSTDSLILTAGQSEFHPIRPDLATLAGPPERSDVVNWIPNPLGTTGSLQAPATWAPVFLFDLPYDASLSDTERFPYYPANVNGATVAPPQTFSMNYLFRSNYLFANQNAAYLATSLPDHFEDRLPLERRVTMYVSENRSDTLPDPEGLFVWDGEDGLENGEYVLYIGTYIPGLRDRAYSAAESSAGLIAGVPPKSEPNLLYQSAFNVPVGSLAVDRVTASILELDPTHPQALTTPRFDPVFALDVITDPTEARGVAPRSNTTSNTSLKPAGLIHPDDWNPAVEYRAGSDGYIVYGNNAAGGWRPQTIRVTDNYLALRVRNVGQQGEVGVISHIVLAPRKRTAGRINVNTVQSRVATFPLTGVTTEHQYFNTLLGLPGVVDAATSVQASTGTGLTGPLLPADDVALMANLAPALPADGSWSDPLTYYGATPLATPPTRNQHDNDPPSTDSDVLVPDAVTNLSDRHMWGGYRLSSMIMSGRTEHADGRYYMSAGALADNGSAFDYNYGASRADRPTLDPGANWWEYAGVEHQAVYPLSNESLRWRRFDEVQARLRRFGNLISTRSDVFEIIMTVEAGYGVDKNNDGFINYRDRDEFVTTAATKASATYERRSPSDQSDGLE